MSDGSGAFGPTPPSRRGAHTEYSQEWRDCPQCGATAAVVFVNLKDGGDVVGSEIDQFDCPNGCDLSMDRLREAFPQRLYD